jgi:hypothetical protein
MRLLSEGTLPRARIFLAFGDIMVVLVVPRPFPTSFRWEPAGGLK